MGVFKLGKMTMGSLFKKPETVQYPAETKPMPTGLKGHIAIDVNDCILCGMCERSCTTNCITVDKAARTWSIYRYQCIQCRYCTTVCPKKCLHMLPEYAPASTDPTADVFEVPEGGKPAEKKADAPADADAKPAATAETAKADTKQPVDDVLLGKIAIMDDEKAQKVRDALGL